MLIEFWERSMIVLIVVMAMMIVMVVMVVMVVIVGVWREHGGPARRWERLV